MIVYKLRNNNIRLLFNLYFVEPEIRIFAQKMTAKNLVRDTKK